MNKYACKLCHRRFPSGRAMAGHMRSHVISAGVPKPLPRPPSPSSASITSEYDVMVMQDPRGNPKKSVKLYSAADQETSSVVQDNDSDADFPGRGRRGARSKRSRRSWAAPSPASSASDATEEEDVAWSLMMLSCDYWGWARSEQHQNLDDDSEEFEEDLVKAVGKATPAVIKYRCEACKKAFPSYQALGGHRASLKRGRGGCVPQPSGLPLPMPTTPVRSSKDSDSVGAAAASSPGNVVHECPHCFRVFESGQALGGHKRVHLAPTLVKCGVDSSAAFDLNLPASPDEEFELSAVYDGELGSGANP